MVGGTGVATRRSSQASAQRSARERLARFLEGKHCDAKWNEEEPKSTGNRGGLEDEVGPRRIADEQQHGELERDAPNDEAVVEGIDRKTERTELRHKKTLTICMTMIALRHAVVALR